MVKNWFKSVSFKRRISSIQVKPHQSLHLKPQKFFSHFFLLRSSSIFGTSNSNPTWSSSTLERTKLALSSLRLIYFLMVDSLNTSRHPIWHVKWLCTLLYTFSLIRTLRTFTALLGSSPTRFQMLCWRIAGTKKRFQTILKREKLSFHFWYNSKNKKYLKCLCTQ